MATFSKSNTDVVLGSIYCQAYIKLEKSLGCLQFIAHSSHLMMSKLQIKGNKFDSVINSKQNLLL